MTYMQGAGCELICHMQVNAACMQGVRWHDTCMYVGVCEMHSGCEMTCHMHAGAYGMHAGCEMTYLIHVGHVEYIQSLMSHAYSV